MKKMIVYHHNDHDGIAAAAVWKMFYENMYDIEYIMIDYDRNLNFDNINFDGNIYSVVFLDFSFSSKNNIDQFKKLLSKRKIMDNVIWFDHHKTSINLLKDIEMKTVCELSERQSKDKKFIDTHIMGMVREGLCGAALVYIANKCEFIGLDDIENHYLENWFRDHAPSVLKYIDDYDCWKHKYGEDTNYLHYGLPLSSPKDEFFHYLLKNIFGCHTYIETGKKIMEYLKFDDKNYHIDMYGFEHIIKIEDKEYKCFCINRKGNSIMFGNKINEYDAVIPFYFINGKWKYSIFTIKDEVNCEAIAKHFGGGGHLKAAGWVTDKLIFEKSV